MSDFKLIKEKKNKKIKKENIPFEGLHLKPRLKIHNSLISIKEIVIVKDDIKILLIQKQFERSFRKLVAITLDIENEGTTSSDCAIVLNEISKTRSILENKFAKDLKEKELQQLERKLSLLEKKIKKDC